MAGQMLFHPPNVAGWDESRWLDTATFRGRWVAANSALGPIALDPDPEKTPYDSAETAETAVAKAIKFWGNPSHHASHPLGSRAVRERGGRARRHALEAAVATRSCARTRCACWWPPPPTCRPADGSPALQQLHAVGAHQRRGRPGRPRPPAVERGMPLPAGTGLSRRSFLMRSAGLALSVYGGSRLLDLDALQAGVAAGGRPLERDDRLGLPRRRHRQPVGARADRRSALPQASPAARAARGRAHAVRRRRPPRLASGGRRPRDAPQGGQGRRHAGGRLRRTRTSRTSPRATSGRSARSIANERTGLARALARPGRLERQPASGPLARRPAGADARDRPRPGGGGVRAPRSTASGRATCGARSRSGCSRRSARSAPRMPARRIRRSPRRATRPPSPRGFARSSRRSRRRAARSSRRSPTRMATMTSLAT